MPNTFIQLAMRDITGSTPRLARGIVRAMTAPITKNL
jgi:hypothetical protein